MNETFEFKTTTDSAIGCVRMCSEDAGCDGTIFYKENKTCIGVKNDSLMSYGSGSCVSSGATHYKLASVTTSVVHPTTGPTDTSSATSAVSESTTGATTESSTAATPDSTTNLGSADTSSATTAVSESTTGSADTSSATSAVSESTTGSADASSATSAVSESTTGATSESTTATTTGSTTSQGCVVTAALVGPIENEAQFSVSSSWSTAYPPISGKLGSSLGWHPATQTVEEYIQVRFVSPKMLTAVATKGVLVFTSTRWLESYRVSISSNSYCYGFNALINSSGTETVFVGNSDYTTLVTNNINPPVVAYCVRIHPLQWHYQIGLQFELYGCNSY